jgi:hypothetical protein
MPDPFTPSPLLPSWPLQLIKDGEVLTHTNLISGLIQPGLEYTAYVAASGAASGARVDTIMGGTTGASITRAVTSAGIPTGGTWGQTTGDGDWRSGAVTPCTLTINLDAEALPHGSTLTAVSLAISPDNSHASIAGLTLPAFFLYEVTNTGAATLLGTALDGSLSFSAYNTPHALTLSGLSIVIDRTTKRYQIRVVSESSGANAKANLDVHGVTVTRTVL